MKIFRIPRIVIIVKLTISKDGHGRYSVTFKDNSVPIPDPIKPGSTGPNTAQLGPMTIDVVPEDARPPLHKRTLTGLGYRVYLIVALLSSMRQWTSPAAVSSTKGRPLRPGYKKT